MGYTPEGPTDAFGNPLQNCQFWCCEEYFKPADGRKFCSRGCKNADAKRRSRKADTTRADRRAAGKLAGFEEGHLYVIRPGDEPVVKVGYSVDWKERLRIMQTSHYYDLKAISLLPTRRYFKNDPPDKEVHMLLDEQDHIRGEWWALTETTEKILAEFGFDSIGEQLLVRRQSGHGS